MPEDLYPATGPAWGWTVLAVALVAVVVGWWAWIWLSTRRPPARRARGAGSAVPVEELRRWALGEVDRLEHDHRAGRLSARDVFQRLSPLLRRFVFEASGSPAHVRSLAELRRQGDAPLAATVEWLYPEEFAPDAPGAVDEGLARARAYLTRWPPASGP